MQQEALGLSPTHVKEINRRLIEFPHLKVDDRQMVGRRFARAPVVRRLDAVTLSRLCLSAQDLRLIRYDEQQPQPGPPRRTTAQRRELVTQLLKEAPERSNRLTAEVAEVDHKTVAAVRRKLESSQQIPRLDKTIGKDRRRRGCRR